MSWKKHFTFVDTKKNPNDHSNHSGSDASSGKYASYLPEYYAGNPQRIDRYKQYDVMDMDSEVNTSLDTIADFSTQSDEYRKSPFTLDFNGEVSSTETEILVTALKQWTRLNDFDKRLWSIFRAVIKYGDCTFIRDPETFKWIWIDPTKIDAIVVNTAKGKEPEEYIIRDIDFAINESILTKPKDGISTLNQIPGNVGKPSGYNGSSQVGTTFGETISVSSSSVVHLSLTEGMDTNWPFGNSILEGVFKVFKQKELLEDAVLIYRIQRAPERRVFYIDVGEMPPHKAMAFVERIKNEIHQKRIPNRTGGSNNIVDAAYNPLSMLEDYFFAQTCLSLDTKIDLLDGRTLTLNEIISEYQNGKVNYVYGLSNVTHEMEPAEIKWAGVTRKNTQVLAVHLDNGEIITATPDHKFIMRDGSEVEAQNLNVSDSLMPLEKSNTVIVKIEWLDDKIDTGDITIESNSDSHWFGLSAGVYVHNSDSRGSKVETLPGGDNLGEIDDLKFFDNKLKRGLGVPSSYLPSGPDDGTASMSDGRVGTAYMQEYRFSKYCKRLQMLIAGTFDREFKMFLKKREYNIDSSLFELYFNEPQSFSKFRQIEIDSAQINVFQPLSDVSYLSKRFILKRFLNMDETEIMENEKLWREENPTKVKKNTADETDDINLSSVGIRPPHEYMPDTYNNSPNAGDVDGTASPISGDENDASGEDIDKAASDDLFT